MRHTTVPPHVPGHRLPRVCSRDALRDQVEAERCIIIICPLSKVGSQVINWGGGRDILDVAHLAHNPLWHMSSNGPAERRPDEPRVQGPLVQRSVGPMALKRGPNDVLQCKLIQHDPPLLETKMGYPGREPTARPRPVLRVLRILPPGDGTVRQVLIRPCQQERGEPSHLGRLPVRRLTKLVVQRSKRNRAPRVLRDLAKVLKDPNPADGGVVSSALAGKERRAKLVNQPNPSGMLVPPLYNEIN